MENKWYESEQRKEDAFFKDLSSSRSKETITYFPKIYYRMKQGLLHIRVEITLGKYQEQLLNLEKKLESGLYCELTDKELKDSYVEYTLLYDTIANRISIEDVQAKDGRLRLMKNVWWEYDKLPHMLIAGGTGGGKTYFILTLMEALLRTNAILFVLDPKNADLADLQAVMPDVYYKKDVYKRQVLNYSMDSTIYFPTLDQYKCNPGMVIQGDISEPVYAPANARVVSVGNSEEIGTYLTLDLGNEYSVICGQLKEVAAVEGEYLEKGQLIGYVAEPTKYYTVEGSNLYLEMLHKDSPVDPLDYLE